MAFRQPVFLCQLMHLDKAAFKLMPWPWRKPTDIDGFRGPGVRSFVPSATSRCRLRSGSELIQYSAQMLRRRAAIKNGSAGCRLDWVRTQLSWSCEATLYQLQAAARLPNSGVSEIAVNAALAMIESEQPRGEEPDKLWRNGSLGCMGAALR